MVSATTGVFVSVDNTPKQLAAGERLLVFPRSDDPCCPPFFTCSEKNNCSCSFSFCFNYIYMSIVSCVDLIGPWIFLVVITSDILR